MPTRRVPVIRTRDKLLSTEELHCHWWHCYLRVPDHLRGGSPKMLQWRHSVVHYHPGRWLPLVGAGLDLPDWHGMRSERPSRKLCVHWRLHPWLPTMRGFGLPDVCARRGVHDLGLSDTLPAPHVLQADGLDGYLRVPEHPMLGRFSSMWPRRRSPNVRDGRNLHHLGAGKRLHRATKRVCDLQLGSLSRLLRGHVNQVRRAITPMRYLQVGLRGRA